MRPARVEIELSPRTGKQRIRCVYCGKIAYSHEARAQDACDTIQASGGDKLQPYFSRRCQWWHLSRDIPEGSPDGEPADLPPTS